MKHRCSSVLAVRKILVLSIGLLFTLTASSKNIDESAHLALHRHYYRLFDTDSIEEFYKVSGQLQQNYIQKGNMLSYYKIRQNEIFFDAEHERTFQAITKANDLLEDMRKSKGEKFYELPYMSLGSIFEAHGAYRVSIYYYQEALKSINPKDSTGLAHIYSQLAAINLTRDPDMARQWIERMGNIISYDSLYYKSYLTLKGQYYFYKGEKEDFIKTKQQFDEFLKRTPALDHNGEQILKIIESAFVGKYGEALSLLEQESQDYDDLRSCDIRIRIYEMTGNIKKALEEADKRRDLRDSLSNSLLFNNLNEISASVGVAKLNEEAVKDRELWLGSVIFLLVIAFALMASRSITRRRYQKRIEAQNEELEIALDEAKESDRMKDIFIKHISHEIRTPLNVITGYAQIISNPVFDMRKEERNKMVRAIGQNTVAITNIVNDLLEVSQEDSKERYRRDDHIVVNDFCRQIMEEAEKGNVGNLKLSFQTTLPDDFAIQSNLGGIERVIQHLLGNAQKFTEQGQVELRTYEGDDDGMVYFAVSDTGSGIPEELHEQVFEQFYKLNFFKQGLGIGLSMSRKIATLLGGTLTIDKDYHEGARFIFAVPVKK